MIFLCPLTHSALPYLRYHSLAAGAFQHTWVRTGPAEIPVFPYLVGEAYGWQTSFMVKEKANITFEPGGPPVSAGSVSVSSSRTHVNIEHKKYSVENLNVPVNTLLLEGMSWRNLHFAKNETRIFVLSLVGMYTYQRETQHSPMR